MSRNNEEHSKIVNNRKLNKYLVSKEKLFIITALLFLIMIILTAIILSKIKDNHVPNDNVVSSNTIVESSTSSATSNYAIIDATNKELENLDYYLLKDRTKIGQKYRFSLKLPKRSEWRTSPYIDGFTEIEIKEFSFIRVQVSNSLADQLEGEKTTKFVVEVVEKNSERYLMALEAKLEEKDSLSPNQSVSPESSSDLSTKSEQSVTKKIDLEKYYNAIKDSVETVNTEAGYSLLEMEKTSVTPGIRIILTENNDSYSEKELRTVIRALNKSLYKIAITHGVNSPRFYYILSGEEVAVNRYIMAPDEVKFSGKLK